MTIEFQTGVDFDSVDESSKHKLFVEGSNNESLDPIILQELLKNNNLPQIEVQTMGRCDNVRSAAQALITHHPFYYFLIDRDDQNENTVEQSWNKFPDINEYNMLIWRKRELENYFIEPNYLQKSPYLKSDVDIKQKILEECSKRVFMDAANLTLLRLHRDLKKPICAQFRNAEEFKDQQQGIERLKMLPDLQDKKQKACELLESESIQLLYSAFVDELIDGTFPLQYGKGNWLNRISGKEVFNILVSGYFEVKNNEGKILQGREKIGKVVKQLLKCSISEQPNDFQELVRLLSQRVFL